MEKQTLICTYKGCKRPQIADCEFCEEHAPKKDLEVKKPEASALSAESLISQAIDQKVPVETMEKLLAMRRELRAEKAKELYDIAMSKFQVECPIIVKSKKVLNKDKESVRYAYAPLEEIIKQTKSFIQSNGFSYKIDAVVEDNWVTAICRITHEFGHSESSEFKIPVDKDSFMTAPQKFASALTFAKRYAFCNAFGILTGDEDNDGQDGSNEDKRKEQEFQVVVKALSKATLKTLGGYKKEIAKSVRYTDEQKAKLVEAVDKRMEELKNVKP